MAKKSNSSAQKRRPHDSAENIAEFAVAILAAGKGTRLKSSLPKMLHRIAGAPLLQHVIAAAREAIPSARIFAIIGHEAELVRKTVGSAGVNFVLQAEQRGTGHAVMCAAEELKKFKHVLVLSGDVPLIRAATLRSLAEFHLRHDAAMIILTASPPDPYGYGRIVRKGANRVGAIVEQRALRGKQASIREINSGIYAFRVSALLPELKKLTTGNYHGEFYLTDVAAQLNKRKEKVLALETAAVDEVLGVNTRADLARLDSLLREQKTAALMESGVSIFRPESCMIDSGVEIGPDTVIHPFVQLLGKTKVGMGCVINSYSVITDSQIADSVEVRPGCILSEARVAEHAVLGPYAHLRPGSDIGAGAHVGNFVETKKTRLGRGSKANHLSYLGDADIGDGVNIGAGTITCNYDGVNKHATTIDDGAFIGSDSTLVAPVKVGKGAYVGASSCITKDVPKDSLALTRSPQVTKENWAAKRRSELRKNSP